MFGCYDYARAYPGLADHAHPGGLEICYLARGRQLYRVGRRDYLLRGGDLFVTFPGEQHSTGGAPQEKGRLYWMILLLPRSRGGRLLNCSAADSRILVEKLLRLPNRHFAGPRGLGRLFEQILVLGRQRREPLQRVSLQNRLVDLLLRVVPGAAGPPRPVVTPPISRLLRHIEAHPDESLTVPALAARVGLSVPRFKARFKEEVGIPPADYVLRCRVELAKQRLAASAVPVTELAFELGFSSSQYFATVFRRYTGQAPGQYRAAVSRRAADRPAG